jgi:hypothetical protein
MCGIPVIQRSAQMNFWGQSLPSSLVMVVGSWRLAKVFLLDEHGTAGL